MSTTDPRVREGVEHLQAAALELIAAARVLLDVAEDAVRDPGVLVDLVGGLRPSPPPAGPDSAAGAAPRDAGVQRIRVV